MKDFIMTLGEYVATFSYEELRVIHDEWSSFERDRYIGECLLRTKVKEYWAMYNIPDNNPVFWMHRIVFEVYRRIAIEEYFSSH